MGKTKDLMVIVGERLKPISYMMRGVDERISSMTITSHAGSNPADCLCFAGESGASVSPPLD